jgi:hypothetical protein
MTEALDVLNAFSTPLKVAWVVWLAWGVGQVFWYQRDRVAVAPPPLPLPRPRPRRPVRPVEARAAEAAPPAPAETPTLESAEAS